MKNKKTTFTISTIAAFVAGVLLQYTLEVTGVIRAYHQWWTNWSGINFVGMLDYAYASPLFHVCAWLMAICGSILFGCFACEFYGVENN